jgi:ribosomal protein S4
VKAGDLITPAPKAGSKKLVTEALAARKGSDLPSWLARKDEVPEGRVVQIPKRSDLNVPLDEQMIVEFASR